MANFELVTKRHADDLSTASCPVCMNQSVRKGVRCVCVCVCVSALACKSVLHAFTLFMGHVWPMLQHVDVAVVGRWGGGVEQLRVTTPCLSGRRGEGQGFAAGSRSPGEGEERMEGGGVKTQTACETKSEGVLFSAQVLFHFVHQCSYC